MNYMNSNRKAPRAFTLVELLVVMAIIAILASLLFPVLARIREQGRKNDARMQIRGLVNAITDYHAKVGRYPVSDTAMKTAIASQQGDFTYGGSSLDGVFGAPGTWSTDNSEVMAILLDREKYPNTGLHTVNLGHVKNTAQYNYLAQVPMSLDTASPGVGQDLIYRDPWGNPYIISLDLNYDGKCRDALYQKQGVSQQSGQSGYYGLINSSDSSGASDAFEYSGGIMVWSLGPDKKGDAKPANADLNRDNILSWQ